EAPHENHRRIRRIPSPQGRRPGRRAAVVRLREPPARALAWQRRPADPARLRGRAQPLAVGVRAARTPGAGRKTLNGRYDPRRMSGDVGELLRQSVLFRRLRPDDRQRVAAVSSVRTFDKGAALFSEGDESDLLYTVLAGHVKVFKTTARGTDVILEL